MLIKSWLMSLGERVRGNRRWLGRRQRQNGTQRQQAVATWSLPRRAEALEERLVLSATDWVAMGPFLTINGQVEHIDLLEQRVLLSTQCGREMYLNFDGARDVSYDGPVRLEHLDVPSFQAPGELAGQEDMIRVAVTTALNVQFADQGVHFTSDAPDRPANSRRSTSEATTRRSERTARSWAWRKRRLSGTRALTRSCSPAAWPRGRDPTALASSPH